MSLSDEMRRKIAGVFIGGHSHGIFDRGSFFTNGDRLVYIPNDGFDKYDLTFDTDGKEVRTSELFDGSYVDIKQLLPEEQDFIPEYEAFIQEYKYEFMQYHGVDTGGFKAKYINEDVLSWVFDHHFEETATQLHDLINLIAVTLLDIEDISS